MCPRHRGIMADYSQPCICAKGDVDTDEKLELLRMTKLELIDEIIRLRKLNGNKNNQNR